MIAVQDVSIYRPENKLVGSAKTGSLTLNTDGASLTTRLVLPGASSADVSTRQAHYALGRTSDGAPFRTETAPCDDTSNGIGLCGVVTATCRRLVLR